MATEADLERIDRAVLNQTEQPPNSNHIFVWDDLIKAGLAPAAFDRSPYCAAGIVWTDWKARAPLLPVQSPFYVPSRITYARAHGLWSTSGHYAPGDEVCWAWSAQAVRSGLGEHVERVIADDGHTITTIGFNTSPEGHEGSQANGDGVFLRHRQHGPNCLGAIRYSTLLTANQAPRHPIRRNPWMRFLVAAHDLHLTGWHDPRHWMRGDAVRGVQWAVGVPCDGEFGPDTDAGVRLFQRFHNDRYGRRLVPDGDVGKLTRWALLQITHFEHAA